MNTTPSQSALTPTLPDVTASHQDLFGQKEHAKQHFVTKGEKKFDRLTYTTVGYVINALLSVVAVWAVERTAGGQKMMDNFRNWAERNVKFAKPETAKMLATKSFFLAGGFLVMPPMKWLEDKKLAMVKAYDRKIYGDAVDTDPNIIQSHKDLEAAPKQSWSSILSSRILALVPFYTGYWLLWDKKSPLAKATGEKVFVDRPIVAASRWVGKMAASLTGNKAAVEKITELNASHAGELLTHLPAKELRATTAHDPVHSTTAYYFISEAITSGMVAWGVYVLTRVLGPIMGKKAAPSGTSVTEPDVAAVTTKAAPEKSVVEEAVRPEVKPPERHDAAEHETPHTRVHHVAHHEQHAAQAVHATNLH